VFLPAQALLLAPVGTVAAHPQPLAPLAPAPALLPTALPPAPQVIQSYQTPSYHTCAMHLHQHLCLTCVCCMHVLGTMSMCAGRASVPTHVCMVNDSSRAAAEQQQSSRAAEQQSSRAAEHHTHRSGVRGGWVL